VKTLLSEEKKEFAKQHRRSTACCHHVQYKPLSFWLQLFCFSRRSSNKVE